MRYNRARAFGGLAALAMGVGIAGCGAPSSAESAITSQVSNAHIVFFKQHVNLSQDNAIYFYQLNGGLEAALVNKSNGQWMMLQNGSIP